MAAWVFWLALGLLVYTYAGFPLTLWAFAAIRRGRVAKGDVTPRVSVIIAAYNEAQNVARRLENALSSDYPPDRLEVLLASDGSSDATESIASCYDESGVRVLKLPRRGKIFALNDAARVASGEVLVFTDANTFLEKGALRALVSNFAEPAVGGVVGNTDYELSPGAESSGKGESLYWRYDKWLKALESQSGSVVSAHGGLYAIRRELYQMPADPAVTDDFAISTAVVEQGYRLVFEPDARAWEETAPKAAGEFRRRVRLMTRGLRGVALRRRLLNPFRYGFYSHVLFTHKVLRRVVPLALPILLLTSLLAWEESAFFRFAFLAQAGFYVLAAGGYATRGTYVGKSKALYVPFYVCLANAAALVALWKFAIGVKISRWEPVRAHAEVEKVVLTGATCATDLRSLTVASATTSASPTGASPTGEVSLGGGRPSLPAPRHALTRAPVPDKVPAAVIVGLDSATGLQSARILAARGVPVIGIATDVRHPCCRTRACVRVVEADTSSPGLIEALHALGPRLDPRAVLFPCTDNSVLLVSRYRDGLTPWFHLALPAAEVVELLVDKARFYTFAQGQGFRVPETYVLAEAGALKEAVSGLTFPCIMKPAVKSTEWNRAVHAKAFRVGSPQELIALHGRYGHLARLIAQEWVSGEDNAHYTCNAYFGARSQPLVTFTSRKLRQWPPTGGEGSLSEEVRNDFVRAETVRLFSHVRHRGLGYVELKQDQRTQEYVILEPNICRPTGRSAQAEAAGVELLYTQYCDVLGWQLPENREQSFRGVKWIHYRRDLQSGFHHWRRGKLTLGDWARSWRGPKQDALFSLRDPVPFFADLTRAAFKVRHVRVQHDADRAGDVLSPPAEAQGDAA